MDLRKTGDLIAEARRQKGLTQAQLARQLHISHTTVSKWERGLGFPEVSLLEPLAGALDLSLEELFRGEVQTEITPAEQEPREPEGRKYIKAVLVCILLAFFLGLAGYVDGQRPQKYGGDPTTIRGTWQHVPERKDEEHYLVTLTASLFPEEETYKLYIDDRLVDEGIWTQEEGYIVHLDGELLDTTVELTREKGYGAFTLQLPGLKNTLLLRKRGDFEVSTPQEQYDDQEEYRKLLTGK